MPVTRSKTKGGRKKASRRSAPAAIPAAAVDTGAESDTSSDLSSLADLDSDFDNDEAQVEKSNNKRPKTNHHSPNVKQCANEEASRILAHKAEVARAQIRGLVNSLPDIEAQAYLALLDNPPKEEEPAPSGFIWDHLPPEVKNMIYRCVLVKATPVKPNISWPNVPDKRSIDKCGLGAHLLMCSKAIYAEGRSIMRAENVFEIGPHFKVCLGVGKSKQEENAEVMYKALVRSEKFSQTVYNGLKLLKNLKELTLMPETSWGTFASREKAEESAALAWLRADAGLRYRISTLRREKLEKVYFVTEREVKDLNHKPELYYIAFRFLVTTRIRRGASYKVDGEDNLWNVDQTDLKLVGRTEYTRKYRFMMYSSYPEIQW